MKEELIRKQQDAEGRIARLETLEQDVAIQKALFQLVPTFQTIPSIRGLWFPGMTVDESVNIPNYALEATILGDQATLPPINVVNDIVPIMEFVPNDRMAAGDSPNQRISGIESWVTAGIRGMTCGGWFRLDALGNQEGFISKWNGAAAFHYLLYKGADDDLEFIISQDGTAGTLDTANDTPIPSTGWHWLIGRWSSTVKETSVDTTHSTAASTVASIYSAGGASFFLACQNGTADFLDGACMVAFIAASYLSDDKLDMLYHRTKVLVA